MKFINTWKSILIYFNEKDLITGHRITKVASNLTLRQNLIVDLAKMVFLLFWAIGILLLISNMDSLRGYYFMKYCFIGYVILSILQIGNIILSYIAHVKNKLINHKWDNIIKVFDIFLLVYTLSIYFCFLLILKYYEHKVSFFSKSILAFISIAFIVYVIKFLRKKPYRNESN